MNDNQKIKQYVQDIQQFLKNHVYDRALKSAQSLESFFQTPKFFDKLRENPTLADVFCASLIWQIRAYEGLQASPETIEEIAKRYLEVSKKYEKTGRVAQAYEVLAQASVMRTCWEEALDRLENAHAAYIRAGMHSESVAVRFHMAEIHVRQLHFQEGIETLSQLMDELGHMPQTVWRARGRMTAARLMSEYYEAIGQGAKSSKKLQEAMLEMDSSDEIFPEEAALVTVDLVHAYQAQGISDIAFERLGNLMAAHDWNFEQRVMLSIEKAQILWTMGEYEQACKSLQFFQPLPLPLLRAVKMVWLQWAIEAGRPRMDPAHAFADYEAVTKALPDDIVMSFSHKLACAEYEIQNGGFDAAVDTLEQLDEAAQFLNLQPFCARARMMLASICAERNDIFKACRLTFQAYDLFTLQRQVVLIHLAGIKLASLRALDPDAWQDAFKNISQSSGVSGIIFKNFDAIPDCINRARDIFKESLERKNISAYLSLGIALMEYASAVNSKALSEEMIRAIEPYIIPNWMAYRAMKFYKLASRCSYGMDARNKADAIARENGWLGNPLNL